MDPEHRAYSKRIIQISLELGAIKIDTEYPFAWASGYRMPIYNDNRLLLGNYEHRKLICDGFEHIIEINKIKYEMIFGVATAGISPATTLANALKTSLGYVRSESKDHGLRKRIEGPDPKGKVVLLVEELISAGRSAARAVHALRDEGAETNCCLCIFDYGFAESRKIFDGSEPFDNDARLTKPCEIIAICDYNTLIETAEEMDYIKDGQKEALRNWRQDPFNSGKSGFVK